MLQKIIDYVRKVKAELEKVAWPTRKDLANSTGVVLVLVAIMTVFLGVIDYAFYVFITGVLNL